jgi:hypothetical protein
MSLYFDASQFDMYKNKKIEKFEMLQPQIETIFSSDDMNTITRTTW